jgi:hypothetical protein
MAVGGRLIDGLHGVTGAQYINAAYHLPNKQTNNAKFTNTGTIITTKKIRIGQEIPMAYGGNLWAGKKSAQQWRQAHPQETQELSRQAENRDGDSLAVKKYDVPINLPQARGAGTVSVKGSTTPRNHTASQRGAQGEMHAVQTDHFPGQQQKCDTDTRDTATTNREQMILHLH